MKEISNIMLDGKIRTPHNLRNPDKTGNKTLAILSHTTIVLQKQRYNKYTKLSNRTTITTSVT